MTTTAIDAVGFCAHYSPQGDWAFNRALRLAEALDRRLNVFHFLFDPYRPGDHPVQGLSREARERLVIERERELRFYYDERLGDYLEAGFRLCEDDEWSELHRCLCRREFQVLVLPCPQYGAMFAHRPLDEFVASFVCPVVLVGPTSPDEVYLNSPAALMADRLDLGDIPWNRVETLHAVVSPEVS